MQFKDKHSSRASLAVFLSLAAWSASVLGEVVPIEGIDLDAFADDTDNDGITDGRETRLGTDPDDADSDGDGFDDGFEDLHGLFGYDPLVADLDTDGLTDSFKILLGTFVNDPDSDGDGLSDLDEFLNRDVGFDPLVATVDTDYDGLPDSFEFAIGTDPGLSDTDGDGPSDFVEHITGLDPTEAQDEFGELVGETLSDALRQELINLQASAPGMRDFPAGLAGELPYPLVTAAPWPQVS